MDFPTGRVHLQLAELAQVSAISHKGTLGLLPVGRKGRQRIAVGDDSGTIHCFEMKRGEAQVIFAFRITDGDGNASTSNGTCGMITAVAVGGTTSGAGGGDRVFATQGSSIVGLSKKGKDFFRMASPLSETMHHMVVEGERIWTGCDYICSAYDNGQDAAFHMCHDKIFSLTAGRVTGGAAVDAVIGCQDNCIRVVRTEDSDVAFQAFTDGPVGAICALNSKGASSSKLEGGLIYGTGAGSIGHLEPANSTTQYLRKTWELPEIGLDPVGDSAGRSITALTSFDLLRDGLPEVIAGRDDGTVAVYRLPDADDGTGACGHVGVPRLREVFSTNLGESIRSLEAGVVSIDGNPEVVACTFRGRICALTTQSLDKGDEGDEFGRTVGAINNDNHAKQLKREVMDLEKRLAAERKRLSGARKGHEGQPQFVAYTPVTQHFQAIASCTLDPVQGAYVISVETPVPLDLVLLHSHVHMDLLEANDQSDSGQTTACITDLTSENGGGLCATYRCEGDTSKLTLRARTTEGDYGDIRLTVVAKIPPKKAAQVLHFSLKPLSLHHKIHQMDPSRLSGRRLNSLVHRGNFSMQVAHEWLAMCLPEVPPRVAEGVEAMALNFENVFTGAILAVSYRRGAMVLRSDSASTLAIMKELVSKEATARRLHITDTFQGDPESVPAFLQALYPKLAAQFDLACQVKLINAVKEISMQEPETPWMSDEYQHILENAERIKKDFESSPRALEYISGIITDLYVDWHKFRGDDARHRIRELENMLTHQSDYATIVAFFSERP